MYTIATLNDLRRHLNLADDDTSADDELVKSLQQASHILESYTNRQYNPTIESRTASIDTDNPTELILPDDLLSLTSLTNGDDSSISLNDVRLTPDDADTPASVMKLIKGASFVYSDSPINAVSITGIWGWHDSWTRAWQDSLDTVQDNPLSSGATTLTVSDADASNSEGLSPRFQVGQLLQIESEYLRVIAVDADTNQLTVQRGVNGTTASSHTQDTSIEVYHPVPAIRDLCVRYAELLFNSVGVFDAGKHDDPFSDSLVSRLRRLSA